MSQITFERLFGAWHAFDHMASLVLVLVMASTVFVALAGISIAGRGSASAPLLVEVRRRTVSWLILAPAMVVPVLAGAAWTVGAVTLLALMCFSEYARVTGLFRERIVSATVVGGILAVQLAALDHWYDLFVALFALVPIMLAVVTLPQDRPSGYLQRTALGVFGFLLFGAALGHLSYMANDWNYRPVVLLVLIGVAASDVGAFVTGKLFGGPKLLVRTSPNKTLSGAAGGFVVSAIFTFLASGAIFAGTAADSLAARIGLAVLIGLASQLGDLTVSAIKRDVGVKDAGSLIPGHGGVLDRFNSLLLAAPAVFHYVGYFKGFGLDQPTRILTGG